MIRPAQKSDVNEVVPLIMIILKDMELAFLNKYGEEKVREVLRQAFVTETFRFSYRRALVLVEEGQVLGFACGYNEEEEAIIDLPLKAIFANLSIPTDELMFTDKEAFANEWYLDSIAVKPGQRGRGVGARLLEALPTFAKAQGAHTLGLSVDDGNPRAKKLYERQGFKEVARTTISGHAYDHMQLKLT